MALYNKIGSLMRQSISQTTVSNGHMTGPSMYNAFRCMSSKLFVGGLSYQTDDYQLKEAFSGFGEVVEARVITDRESGRSRGFGFVSYNTEDCAKEAMNAMDGQDLNGLSYQTDDYQLKEAFSGFGEVVEARVITDRESGRSRGFGFVSYNTEDCAKEAMNAMDGQVQN
ncbi:glycine-rich RNA-binding protein 2 [Artemisia annua]|uniref:Glycine-rich RNA-binding protein 2 n=1 Tax=Artemisia annua TaxID=35608 RepID=A0A2U1P4X3_ARTAN|nr:glycine-rich RNA-binding protein 2 [Artemisia annua]